MAAKCFLDNDFPRTASWCKHGAKATAIRLVASSFKRKMVSRTAVFEKRSRTVLLQSSFFSPLTGRTVCPAAAMYAFRKLKILRSATASWTTSYPSSDEG
eukprot:Skav235689  [mRNA]  locus=scaffold280:118712:120899:- [translate_table: standard]